MSKVTYIEFDGDETEVDLQDGWTLMQGAIQNGVEGIEGECGGSCACATCHCYVDEAFLGKLDPMSDIEDQLLDGTASERKPNSRLSCQIKMSPELDGIVVRLPEEQC
jgi:2Fe-2S ferredoxin